MKSILKIAQQAAVRASVPVPPKLFGANNRVVDRIKIAAMDTMEELAVAGDGYGWSELQSVWVLEVQPGQYMYDLPNDWRCEIPGTEYGDGAPALCWGPSGPQAWAALVNGVPGDNRPFTWRIKGKKLHIFPTPTQHEIISIEYVSRYPVLRPLSTLEPNELEAGGQLPRLPLVPAEGVLNYAVEGWGVGQWGQALWDDADPVNDGTFAAFLTKLRREAPDVLGWSTESGPYARAAEFERDSDGSGMPEHLLSLGITWRLQEHMKQPFENRRAEYWRQIEVAQSNSSGAPRVIVLGRSGLRELFGDCYEGANKVPLGGNQWLLR